ncbi:hypothetical protein PITCH_A520010 [uncultured Desulfobacterium sp.]|uniref:Uncharacterized protein n=1 Tax=uncultured Desulfobacterium sp. TaxID=201089 RepID=A0A445N0P3_9BACT|nr:hypothetical protein PITCH_A520010 [uncultured Desulfobacterium sp.]
MGMNYKDDRNSILGDPLRHNEEHIRAQGAGCMRTRKAISKTSQTSKENASPPAVISAPG